MKGDLQAPDVQWESREKKNIRTDADIYSAAHDTIPALGKKQFMKRLRDGGQSYAFVPALPTGVLASHTAVHFCLCSVLSLNIYG